MLGLHPVVPVVTTGLHCGRRGRRRARAGRAGSSPSSRRGSIAARPNGAPTSHARSVVPVVTTGLHCGSSPSRARPLDRSLVVPVVTTGLHCGIATSGKAGDPLSRSSPSSRRGSIAGVGVARDGDAVQLVVPVVTTGLHCGVLGDRPTVLPKPGSSPSSRRGSIAAGPTGSGLRRAGPGRPRRHDGAPLRPVDGVESRPGPGVVPVVTTGLHCGRQSVSRSPTLTRWRRPHRHDGAPLRQRECPDWGVQR